MKWNTKLLLLSTDNQIVSDSINCLYIDNKLNDRFLTITGRFDT